MCPGIADKVKATVARMCPAVPNVKVVAPPERRKSAWLGGSILASLDGFPEVCRSRQEYAERGVAVCDTCCDYDIMKNYI